MPFYDTVAGLACPTVSFCVVTAENGDIATTDWPLIVNYPWTVTMANGTWSMGQSPLACATASLCVAMELSGYFIAGTAGSAGEPAITEDPTNLRTTSGSKATFKAVATGGTAVRVRWQETTNDGATYQNIAGPTTSTLTFIATAGESGYGYRAVFLGTRRDAESSTADLVIAPAQIPQMQSSPTATFVAGKPASVALESLGVPTPVLSVSGTLPKGLEFRNIGEGFAIIWGTPLAGLSGKYHLWIAATNSIGSSGLQAFTLTMVSAPRAPEHLQAKTGTSAISIRWMAPTSSGGSSVTGYDVYESTISGRENGKPVNSRPLAASARSYRRGGLKKGVRYFFTVKAINRLGLSPASNQASAVPS
jgi:hypothetical protein